MIGGTGAGKSTFCNLITGKDPRLNDGVFVSKASNKSITSKVEIVPNLTWFDGNGSLTLIDSPGLSDTEGRDQNHLD